MWNYLPFLLASPAAAAVIESLAALPLGWTASDIPVSADQPVQLEIALQYRNINKLQSQLKAVSDPSSPQYGKYLDVDAMNTLFAPSSQSVAAVQSWLSQHNAQNVQHSHGTLSFRTTVGKANEMLNTNFAFYTNGKGHALRTMGYSVPDELAKHIDLISPTTYFANVKRQVKRPEGLDTSEPVELAERAAQRCFTAKPFNIASISVQCLRQFYQTETYQADPNSGSTVSFANFLGESPSHSDLEQFEKKFGIPLLDFTTLALINGGVDDQNPATESDGEADLDVQLEAGIAQGLPIYSYITGGVAPFYPDLLEQNASQASNEPYLQFNNYLLAQPNSKIPYVISQSYADHENTVPPKYATRVCNQYGMLGVRGKTVLAGSGDEGVGAVCRDNRPKGNLMGSPQFTPFFPVSCPYVTAVGGTQAQYPEVAWEAGGGGFSFYFEQPWYQQSAVQNYLDNNISPFTKNYYSSNGYVNFSGRGIPDVSAHSLTPWILVINNGTLVPSGGTSAATPIFAGVVALLNDARLRAGKPVMGFLNPWLYTSGYSSLNDITGGGAVGCNGVNLQTGQKVPGAGIIPYASWNATVGWDPVTGFGTPNFPKMMSAALS